MAKRTEFIRRETVDSLYRHHPYLALLQKEDWREYLILIAEIYDVLDESSQRVPIESIRSIAMKFYSARELASTEMKVSQFFSMAIGELEVFKDSHDQFGQRYIEGTRSGQRLLQMMESLLSERSKFSGTGAETLLGALNDILISRREMTAPEAIEHHHAKIKAYREDVSRIREYGVSGAELLPLAHTNEALFSQAEEAAIDVLQSIEDVKIAIEEQRRELATSYFRDQRSVGLTLSAVADFYRELHSSAQYESYVQTKELFSHLEAFQTRYSQRNVDRLLASIEDRDLITDDKIKRSPLRSFMRQFGVSDFSIQEKVKAQLNVLQQQVLYAISTDVEGLQPSLHALLSNFSSRPHAVIDFLTKAAPELFVREDEQAGAVQLFDFELPVEVEAVGVLEESIDLAQEKELFLALVRAEEGTLKEILARLHEHLNDKGHFTARDERFPGGLAEYYVFSEIEVFDSRIEKIENGLDDIRIDSKYGCFVLRRAPSFTLRRKGNDVPG